MNPYLYVTENYGAGWIDISVGLPDYPINVVYEDCKNPNLLFVGNDVGVFYTLDRGETWTQLEAELPPVVVRDLLVHPREGDLVIGTYGRGAWVGDVTPLQQWNPEVANSDVYLFDIEPKPQLNRSQQAEWGEYKIKGSNQLRTSNEPTGLEIWYRFKTSSDEKAQLTVESADGKEVHKRELEAREGLRKVYWNTRSAAPGEYKVSLTYKGKTLTKAAQVTERWQWPVLNYRGDLP